RMRLKLVMAVLFLLTMGCSLFSPRTLPLPTPPLKLLVAEVTLRAPVTSPTDLQSFREPLSPEVTPVLLAQLIEEVEVKAQRFFIEYLAQQPGFTVVPFAETRRMRANLDSTLKELDATQLHTLGAQAGADVVLSGHILDFGKVRWQYWVPGLALSMLTETLIV